METCCIEKKKEETIMNVRKKTLKKIELGSEFVVSVVIAECGFFLWNRMDKFIPLLFILAGIYYCSTALLELDRLDWDIVVCLDMDGCLAEFRPEATDEQLRSEKYYEELSPIWNLIKAVRFLEKEATVIVVTKILSDPAKKGKGNFLTNVGLEGIEAVYVPNDKNKADFIKRSPRTIYVLVDDYSHNLRQWEKSGNVAVKFLNGINGTKGTWKGKPSVSYYQTPEKIAAGIIDAAYASR